jgi:hypothetical protein
MPAARTHTKVWARQDEVLRAWETCQDSMLFGEKACQAAMKLLMCRKRQAWNLQAQTAGLWLAHLVGPRVGREVIDCNMADCLKLVSKSKACRAGTGETR